MSKEKNYGMLGRIVSLLMTVPAMYGTLVDLLEKLNSDNGAFWTFALKKMLRKEKPPAFWDVWRKIELGVNFSLLAGAQSLVEESDVCFCSSLGIDFLILMIERERKTDLGHEFDLVIYKTSDLVGESRGASVAEIRAAADWIGLKRCSYWMAPKLRLDYQDQPKGEQLLMIMDDDLFHIGRDDKGLYLLHRTTGCGAGYYSDAEWLFVRPHTAE